MGPISQHKSKKRTFSKIYQSLVWTILHCETRIKQHLQNHPSLKQQSSEITHTCKQAKTLQQPCPSSTFRPATRCWNHWRHESTTWQLCLWTARPPNSKQRCHSTFTSSRWSASNTYTSKQHWCTKSCSSWRTSRREQLTTSVVTTRDTSSRRT